MHDSVGQFQTIYVNLDFCQEPLESNRWYQKPKIPSSLPVVARQALLENLIKFRICKIFLLLIKKRIWRPHSVYPKMSSYLQLFT